MASRNPPVEYWSVYRWDNNPANTYTFGHWVFISRFPNRDAAVDFVRRASYGTQVLRVMAG